MKNRLIIALPGVLKFEKKVSHNKFYRPLVIEANTFDFIYMKIMS